MNKELNELKELAMRVGRMKVLGADTVSSKMLTLIEKIREGFKTETARAP